MNFSEHFTLQEMIFSQTAARRGIDNTPEPKTIDNLKRLCMLLEDVRDVCGVPIRISSGYRGSQLNLAIGGARNSQHMTGCAADFSAPPLGLNEVIENIVDANLNFDQLIREFDSWIHISVPNNIEDNPRKQILIIDKKGTRLWLPQS